MLRTYRVAGILSATLTDETFERPSDFNLEKFWNENKRSYEQSLLRETARVRLTTRGLRMLNSLWSGVSRAANESAGVPDEAGAVEVTIPIESIDDAAAKLMQLGTEAKVLGPAALRARLADQALAITTLYGAQRNAS
jgi:predicted DNA-binding transcriptional regulator YafY